MFRFADILGKKPIPNNPYLRDGIYPYAWKSGEKYEWYAYKPTPRDFEQITQVVDNYLELFGEPFQSQGMSQQMR